MATTSARHGRAASSAADRVDTEPIVLPPARLAAPGDGVAHGAAQTPANDTEVIDPSSLGTADDRPAAASAPASARAVRRADRERRRFERQEVKRFTRRSRHRRLAWLVASGVVLLVVGGAVAAAYSPLMALREVRVEGLSRTPADQVVAAFDDTLGTPLALVSSTDVQDALSGFPLIETYTAETIPPGTLIVRVVERTPVGVVETSDGLALVDAAGVVIERPDTRPDGQPVIDAGAVTSPGFRAAAGVVRSLPIDIRPQVVRVTAETADDVRLELADGRSVVWGSAEDSGLKADVLARLIQSSPDATRFDVSAPLSPVAQ